jgi:hypothetical protein
MERNNEENYDVMRRLTRMRIKIKFFVALMYLPVIEFSSVPAIPRYELVYTVIRFVLVSAKLAPS